MCPNDADDIVNSVDIDQTAPLRGSLIWVCTVYLDISAPILSLYGIGHVTNEFINKARVICLKIVSLIFFRFSEINI